MQDFQIETRRYKGVAGRHLTLLGVLRLEGSLRQLQLDDRHPQCRQVHALIVPGPAIVESGGTVGVVAGDHFALQLDLPSAILVAGVDQQPHELVEGDHDEDPLESGSDERQDGAEAELVGAEL